MKYDLYLSPNPKNLAKNRQFPDKMLKHESPISIQESIKPIEMKM